MKDTFVIRCLDCGEELDLKDVLTSTELVIGKEKGILVGIIRDTEKIHSITCSCGAVVVY